MGPCLFHSHRKPRDLESIDIASQFLKKEATVETLRETIQPIIRDLLMT